MDEPLISDATFDSATTIERKDIEQIRNAQEFFKSQGLIIGDDGLIVVPEDVTLLGRLHTWHEDTSPGGIDMPTEDEFYKKVLLAVSLWRQKQGKEIVYLLGKGIGVEIALKGNVVGRVKREVTFPYRSHSDFEIYGLKSNLTLPYSVPFKTVFWKSRIFPI